MEKPAAGGEVGGWAGGGGGGPEGLHAGPRLAGGLDPSEGGVPSTLRKPGVKGCGGRGEGGRCPDGGSQSQSGEWVTGGGKGGLRGGSGR